MYIAFNLKKMKKLRNNTRNFGVKMKIDQSENKLKIWSQFVLP